MKKVISDLKKNKLDLVIIFLILFRLVHPFYQTFQGGDDTARYFISNVWAKYYLPEMSCENLLIPDIDWLPLHFWFAGALMSVFENDSLLLFFHAAISLTSTYFFYKIALILSNSKAVSKICLFFILIFPAHINLSSSFMSEPIYSFALFGGIYFFLKFIKYVEFKDFLLNTIFCSAAVLLRYEGWIFAIANLFAIMIFSFDKINFKRLIIGFLPLFLIFILLVINHFKGFGFLRFIETSDDQVKYYYDTFGHSYTLFLRLFPSYIPFVFLFFIFSIFYFKDKIYKAYYFINIFMIFAFFYKLFNFSIVPDFRYMMFYSLLCLIPFVIFISSKSKILIIIYSIMTLILFSVSEFMIQTIKGNIGRDRDLISLKAFVGKIDHGNFFIDYVPVMNNYLVVSKLNLPLHLLIKDDFLDEHVDFKVIDSYVKKENCKKLCVFFVSEVPEIRYGRRTDFQSIYSALKLSQDVNYIVLHNKGVFQNIFNVGKRIITINDFKFKLVFNNGNFNVYEEIK